MKLLSRTTIVVLALIPSACATAGNTLWSSPVRPAQDAPVQFDTEDGSLPESGCRSPLIDPRDQSRIRLVRSGSTGTTHRGDYEVPAGKYGVATGELLRIDCGTGQAIGVVPD